MGCVQVTDVVRVPTDRILTGVASFLTPGNGRGNVRRLEDGTWRVNIGSDVWGPFPDWQTALRELDQQCLGRGWLMRAG